MGTVADRDRIGAGDEKAIFFDLDGTLVRFTAPYEEILAGAVEAVEGVEPDGWLADYNDTFFDLFETFEPDPVRTAFDRVDGSTDAAALEQALLERELEHTCTPDGIHEDLERLAEDHALGVLTNGVPEWQEQKLRAHDLDRHFDAFVASYEVGVHKPHPDIFRAAGSSLEADRYAMVGDSDADVMGARDVGWATMRYDGQGFGDLPGSLESAEG